VPVVKPLWYNSIFLKEIVVPYANSNSTKRVYVEVRAVCTATAQIFIANDETINECFEEKSP